MSGARESFMQEGDLGLQALGALGWSILLLFAPASWLLPGSLFLAPLFVLLERERVRKYGFLPGAFLKGGILALAMFLLWLQPFRYLYLRQAVNPFPAATMSLAEVGRNLGEQHIRVAYPTAIQDRMVSVPRRPTQLRELFAIIEKQTNLEHRVAVYCGTNAPLMFMPNVTVAVYRNEPK
jgi:hypothetical protein